MKAIASHLNTTNRRIQALVNASATDDLTGALRRGEGLDALEREVQRARRAGNDQLVVAFVDVDGLKSVNDREGHEAGDRLLKDVDEGKFRSICQNALEGLASKKLNLDMLIEQSGAASRVDACRT